LIYHGHVQDGRIVLDESVTLPEGAEVAVELRADNLPTTSAMASQGQSLREILLRHAGKAIGLPPDAALNHDHYLYGTPKQ